MGAIKDKFNYCEQSGIITLRSSGERTGWTHPSGYTYLSVQENGKTRNLLYHRVAYALYHDVDPHPFEIDHIDRNKGNNIITNLRLVTVSEQNLNRQKILRDIIDDDYSQLRFLTTHGTLPKTATIYTPQGDYIGGNAFQPSLF